MKKKILIVIFALSAVVAVSILLFHKASSPVLPADPQEQVSFKLSPPAPHRIKSKPVYIDYTQAPDYVGKNVCVTGFVDHIDTSVTNTLTLSFCADTKQCPFGAVIFKDYAPKFLTPSMYLSRKVEITGTIIYYEGFIRIVLTDPAQIKIVQ